MTPLTANQDSSTGTLAIRSSAVFGVIYADPPWEYTFPGTRAVRTRDYDSMLTSDICSLAVPSSKDCVLFLWAIAPRLLDAVDVIKAWGFKYKTHAVWDKELIGLGGWFRGQHELLMVATKGHKSCPPESLRIPSVIRSRRGAHSSKPDRVRDLIAKWYPDDDKLEMFARPYTDMWPTHEGWTMWGNQMPDATVMTPNEKVSDAAH